MLNDEGSVKGKGASIMLPPQGNPFTPGQPPPPTEAFPSGAETAPRDLAPEDVAAMFSGPAAAESTFAPEEAEALSFGLRADTDIPGHEAEAAPGEVEAFDSGLRADADLPGHEAAAPAAALASAEELAAREPSSPADRVAGEADASGAGGVPPGAMPLPGVPTTAPGMAVPATTVAGGQALPGLRAFAGAQIQVAESAGVSLETFKRGEALKGKAELVNMLVPDGRLVTLWTEIDALEGQLAATPQLSHKGAADLLDRLTAARNYLMNDRDNFEEADRLVAEVKYRLATLKRSSVAQHAEVILPYLLVFLVALVIGLVLTGPLGDIITGKGTPIQNLVWTILIGGLGGVTGALYGLWTHVARDRDYDPQFALWYYSNPVMGLLLGSLVYVLVLAGGVVASGGQGFTPSPYTVWVLAFAVGFQQNLAFSLLNTILKRIIPQEERTAKPAETGTGAGAGSPRNDTPTFPQPKK